MSNNRVIFQNWIVDLGRDPDKPIGTLSPAGDNPEIDLAVRRALGMLTENEREFIVRFYFMGQTYQQLSEDTGREQHKLNSLHERSIRKMRCLLSDFVHQQFGVFGKCLADCPLCASPASEAINRIIMNRDKSRTWRTVMLELKNRFGIEVRTPQLLIGHEKYHIASHQPEQEEKP